MQAVRKTLRILRQRRAGCFMVGSEISFTNSTRYQWSTLIRMWTLLVTLTGMPVQPSHRGCSPITTEMALHSQGRLPNPRALWRNHQPMAQTTMMIWFLMLPIEKNIWEWLFLQCSTANSWRNTSNISVFKTRKVSNSEKISSKRWKVRTVPRSKALESSGRQLKAGLRSIVLSVASMWQDLVTIMAITIAKLDPSKDISFPSEIRESTVFAATNRGQRGIQRSFWVIWSSIMKVMQCIVSDTKRQS